MRPPKAFPPGTVEELVQALPSAKSPSDLVRIQAVLMRASSGLPPVEIAKLTGLSVHTVHSLHSMVLRDGVTALVDRPGRGGRRHGALTPPQEQEILRSLEQQSATGQILVVQSVKDAVERKIGHPVGRSSIYRMLARQGWRKLSPRSRHPGGDPLAAELFKKNSAPTGKLGDRRKTTAFHS